MPEARPPAPGPAHPGLPERAELQAHHRAGWADGLPVPPDARGPVGERHEDPIYFSTIADTRPPVGHDPRAAAPLPLDRDGSASYQSLTPLPADDRVRPPSTALTGDTPSLAPAGRGELAPVQQGFDRSAEQPRPMVDEDSEPTTPLPVILPGAASIPRPAQIDAPRGPFEPARPTQPTSITGSVEPPPRLDGGPHAAGSIRDDAPGERGRPAVGSDSPLADDISEPAGSPESRPIPEAASEKLEQIKDLYLTAEAIGEDALDKHFEQVSQRQRELIKEFFDRSHPANGDVP